MSSIATLIDGYEEHICNVGGWNLQVITYQLGHKFVCIVNNLDPGATICRVCGPTRREALQKGLEDANASLAQMVVSNVLQPPKPPVLESLQHRGTVYTVQGFVALPLATRMELILSGELIYYATGGSTLQAGEAMKQLRKACEPVVAVAA